MVKSANSGVVRIIALFAALILVFGMLAMPVFAHDDAAHDHKEEDKELTGFAKWWDSYNQIVGWIIVGLVAVAGIVAIILWIPKENTKVKKNKR